ncbi:MAG: hypothetical protein KGO22_01740 [Gammaproteobacteria bacterium]|nr:hypothetical protein [Gammaproteobacteria bacterium]
MFRTLVICMALMAAVAFAVAVASADEPVATSASKSKQAPAATVTARAGATKSASSPGASTSANAGKSSDAQSGKPPQASSDKGTREDAQPSGDVRMSGMSILGNEDAPKSLVIVPWKSAEIGKMPGLSMLLDDAVRPVDKDVFLRELAYYQVREDAK